MKIIVDTCVWSLALRRLEPDPQLVTVLSGLIEESRLAIIGPIRQEILSGVKSRKQFDQLSDYLKPFDDVPIRTSDYVLAAEFFNACRSKGVSGGQVDFLICAIAAANGLAICTVDPDFSHYAQHIPIELYQWS